MLKFIKTFKFSVISIIADEDDEDESESESDDPPFLEIELD
jgi:hypothetical protein